MAIRAIVLSVAGLILSTSILPLVAQDDYSGHPVAVTKITSDLVTAPSLGSSSSANSTYASVPSAYGPERRNKSWLRVEFQFEVHPPQNAAFLDEATFKVIIEGRDISTNANNGEGIPVGLSGTVTYVNIYAGKNACGVVFLDPSTVDRYAGPGPNGVNDFLKTFDVHVEASISGTTICTLDKNQETNPQWYTQMKPISGFVYNKDQTPFLTSDLDKYPPIKLRAASLE